MRRVVFLALMALAGLGCHDASEQKSINMAPKSTIDPNAPVPAAVAMVPPKADVPGELLVDGRVEPAKKGAAKPSDYEQRLADARRAVDVTVYGAAWCPSCRETRKWLDAQGMAYSERDVDKSAEASQTLRRLNPRGTIPVIDVEGEVVVGFAPEAVDRAIRRRAALKVN